MNCANYFFLLDLFRLEPFLLDFLAGDFLADFFEGPRFLAIFPPPVQRSPLRLTTSASAIVNGNFHSSLTALDTG
jgi:hypothetical protein